MSSKDHDTGSAAPKTSKTEAIPPALRACLDVLVAGGALVSSNECSVEEIIVARACNRFYVDENSLGYVARPKGAVIAISKYREVEAAARNLFDNRLGWGGERSPHAPRVFWADLGAALYGEDDPMVVELRG